MITATELASARYPWLDDGMTAAQQQDAALLGVLFRQLGHAVPRADLARLAAIAPEQLGARLAPYVEAGYPIEYHPQGGITLHEPPDIWCAEEIAGRCAAPPGNAVPMWSPMLLAETASTNDVARSQARKGARSGFVVAAARQTAGRGRLGRAWESPAGRGLYVSILLRPELALAEAGQLTILASVAAADAVETVTGQRPRIKWPNDLLLRDRKLAGVLIETEARGARLDFAVIGIGLNVRHAADDFSPEVRDLATSLLLATSQPHRRADVLVALLDALSRRLAAPFAETREAWAASSLTLGQRVTLHTLRGPRQGQALGLDESGALLLRHDSGHIEPITAGDMQAV